MDPSLPTREAFLLDANLSPETSAFLRATLGLDVTDLPSLGLTHLEDPDVVAYARRTGRVIISFDLDIAGLHHRGEHGQFGVIIHTEAGTIPVDRSLVVVQETRTPITPTS